MEEGSCVTETLSSPGHRMIWNIWVWKHWKEQLPRERLWEWHVLMAHILAAHQDASSISQHQGNKG